MKKEDISSEDRKNIIELAEQSINEISNGEVLIHFYKKDNETTYDFESKGTWISLTYAIKELLSQYIKDDFLSIDDLKFIVSYIEKKEKEL